MQEISDMRCAKSNHIRLISATINIPSGRIHFKVKYAYVKTERCIPYGRSLRWILLHPYYTPFFTKIQVNLAKIAFFVDYDGDLCLHFYVNFSLRTIAILYHFQLFDNI